VSECDRVNKHAPDCAATCGGTYICSRCELEFGWCMGAYDDTPGFCDECANWYVDADESYVDDGESPILARTVGDAMRRSGATR
jgi:hypothetical protein